MNRRQFFQNSSLLAAAANAPAAAPANVVPAAPQEIYKLLGFATMSGEDPLKLWARLRPTSEWLAGPLAPDAWSGQVFVADHGDVFAFRFLSLPAKWMASAQVSRPRHTARSNGRRGSTSSGRHGGVSWDRAPGMTPTPG